MGLFSALGAGIGRWAAQPDEDRARQYEDHALQLYQNLSPPDLQRIHAEQLGPSELNKVQVDPRYKQAVLGALDAYGKVAQGGGYTSEDRAEMAQMQRANANAAKGRQEALMQQAASQGGVGTGAGMAAQLYAQQAQADQANQAGTQIALQGRQRALDAYGQAANLASGARAQDYGEQANRANANDAINRFNTGARQQADYYNAGLGQQDFSNRMSVAGAQSGAYNRAADRAHDRVDQAAGIGAGIGSGVDGAADAAMSLIKKFPIP